VRSILRRTYGLAIKADANGLVGHQSTVRGRSLGGFPVGEEEQIAMAMRARLLAITKSFIAFPDPT
jgi:hypothetical protein